MRFVLGIVLLTGLYSDTKSGSIVHPPTCAVRGNPRVQQKVYEYCSVSMKVDVVLNTLFPSSF